MDVGILSSEFLDLLKKFRGSVNQEIEALENSSEDINALVKAADEVGSLLGSEGLSLFVEQLKDLLETVTTDESNPVAIENGEEILETSNAEKDKEEPVDVDIKKITRKKEFRGVEAMLRHKRDWALTHAHLLSNILVPVLQLTTVDRKLGLMFYMNAFMACDDTNMLADELHVRRCGNSECEEITFKCFDYEKSSDETYVDLHTDMVKRIHKRMMKFIELYADPLHVPHFSKLMWIGFCIRVNSLGESSLHIRARYSDDDLPTLIDKLKEEFNSDKAKDCNLHSLVIMHPDDKSSMHVVFGTQHILEKMWNMSFVIDSNNLTSWDPVAMRNLSKALYKLAKPNKAQTGIVLFNLFISSAVPTLYMADNCRNVVHIHPNNKIQEFVAFEAGRNSMLNVTCSKFTSWQEVLTEHFIDCSEVCLVIGGCKKIRWNDITYIIHDEKISKVIFLNTFENLASTRKLTNFFEFNNVRNPFILTQVVYIDLSPFREDVELLLLLERSSKLPGNIVPNRKFSTGVFNIFKDGFENLRFPRLGKLTQSIGKVSPEVILKSLSHQLQVIQEIPNLKPLTKASNKRASGKPQQKIEGSNISELSELQQIDVDKISNTGPSRKTQLQAIDNTINVPPSKETLTQPVDEVSNIPPLRTDIYMASKKPLLEETITQPVEENLNILPMEKEHLQITDKTSNAASFKSKIFLTPRSEIPKMTSVRKDLMSIETKNETTQNLSANLVESNLEEMKFITSYEVSCENKVFLDDLNESQKMVMTLVIKETADCDKLNTDREYHTAISLKKERANFEAKHLSDTLVPLLPRLVSEAFLGLTFQQLDMIPCPSTKALSEKYFIILEKNTTTGKILNTLNSNVALVPLQRAMSYKAKNICKSVVNFILKSKHPMFNEQEGGLWCMIIRVNSKGDPWLFIEGKVDTNQEAVWVLSDLVPKLKSFFLTGLGARKVQDLQSVILSIFTKTSAESRVVFGDTMFLENAGPFRIKFHGMRYRYYNPYGMMGLGNEILKLAAVDKKSGVVQVGYGCGIESLKLAMESGKFCLLRHPAPLDIYFFTKVNCIGMGKFVYHPVSHAQAMESVIVNEMAQYSNVSLELLCYEIITMSEESYM